MHDTKEKTQQFILIGVETDRSLVSAEESLDELRELLMTAGGEEIGRVIQKLDQVDPRTYIGSGKTEEAKAAIKMTGADGVICDDELTPAQLRNLSDALDCKVIDRTLLILDIFSQHAVTKEGQMQIELAQLEYRLTRLTGLGTELSRQGAAVGVHTRGAGETKLEMDRRHIRSRISVLKHQLKEVAENRTRERISRKKNEVPIVALVGYTNAGKSTLFNRLADASVLEQDKLFATLDTTVRRLTLPDDRKVLLIDTVGFIHKLPANLIKAFRATLEEAAEADILLHVVDASHPMAEIQMKVTYDELLELKAADKPIITVLNKQDLVEKQTPLTIPYQGEEVLKTCAMKKEDQEKILLAVQHYLEKSDTVMDLVIPFDQGGFAQKMHTNAVVLEEEYKEDGLHMKVRVPSRLRRAAEPYLS